MKDIVINIILFFIMIIGLLLLFKKKPRSYKIVFIDKHYKKIIIVLFIIVLLTSIYKLMDIPRGIMLDEAGMYYDARLIARYGIDRYLNKFPVYLINFDAGQSAMYAYLVALLIKIFGSSYVLIRVPQVIFRLLSFISAYYLIKNEEDKLKRVVFMVLLTIIPYFIMQSRWGLDCNLLVHFLIISISLLVNAIYKNSNKLLVLSGLMFGLSLYTYVLSYIIIPIFLIGTVIYLLYIKKITIKKVIVFFIPIIILGIPLLLMILVNNGIIDQINSFITIPKLPFYRGGEISLLNIIPNIGIFPYLLTFCFFIYNAIPSYGTVYFISIPLVYLGLYFIFKKVKISIKKKKLSIDTIIILLFLSVILCMLLIEEPIINKANAIYLSIIYIITVGIINIVNKNKTMLKFITILFLVNYLLFLSYYFVRYNKEYPSLPTFSPDFIESLDYVRDIDKKTVYINPGITQVSYIYLFLKEDIDPVILNNHLVNVEGHLYFDNNPVDVNGKTYIFDVPKNLDNDTIYITKDITNFDYQYKQIGFIYILSK